MTTSRSVECVMEESMVLKKLDAKAVAAIKLAVVSSVRRDLFRDRLKSSAAID